MGRVMELAELYKRLGQKINIREDIRKEIEAVKSDELTGRSQDRINSLEREYDLIQRQVIEIDRSIRKLELARAGIRG